MRFLKVTCSVCSHYKACPQRTRLFVNYCGSDRARVKEQIRDAETECSARRGYLFKRETILGIAVDISHDSLALSLSR